MLRVEKLGYEHTQNALTRRFEKTYKFASCDKRHAHNSEFYYKMWVVLITHRKLHSLKEERAYDNLDYSDNSHSVRWARSVPWVEWKVVFKIGIEKNEYFTMTCLIFGK